MTEKNTAGPAEGGVPAGSSGTAVPAGGHVCVAGVGVSGPPVVRALLARGLRVTVVNSTDDERARAGAEGLRAAGAEVVLGRDELAAGGRRGGTSPGWRPAAPPRAAAPRAGLAGSGREEQ